LSTITVLIASVLILPAVNSAQAATVEDGKIKLSPKAFGPKTSKYLCDNERCSTVNTNHKGVFDGFKKEEVKTYQKNIEHFKALQFMKDYYKNYKIGF
jgi:hypothetical protein